MRCATKSLLFLPPSPNSPSPSTRRNATSLILMMKNKPPRLSLLVLLRVVPRPLYKRGQQGIFQYLLFLVISLPGGLSTPSIYSASPATNLLSNVPSSVVSKNTVTQGLPWVARTTCLSGRACLARGSLPNHLFPMPRSVQVHPERLLLQNPPHSPPENRAPLTPHPILPTPLPATTSAAAYTMTDWVRFAILPVAGIARNPSERSELARSAQLTRTFFKRQ